MSDFSHPDQVTTQSKGRIRRLLKRVRAYTVPGGAKMLEQEAQNVRLNQLLEQSPQAYAFWSDRGVATISPLLAKWLGVKKIDSVNDMIYALSPTDAAALDGLWQRLQRDGQPFSLRAKTADEQRILGIQAERRDGTDGEHLVIFWFTDMTHTLSNVSKAQLEKNILEQKYHEHLHRLQSLPLPVWIRDSEGILMWVNDAYVTMVESTFNDVIEQQKELMGSKSGMAKTIAQRARNDREPVSENHPLVIQGERRLMQLSETPLGHDNQTIGIAQDMTVLDEMQSELRRFRASTQELLRALNTGIAIFNPKTQLTFYNDAFTALFPLEDVFLDDKPTLGEVMEALREKRRLPEQADFRTYKKQWLDRFTSLIAPHEEMMHLPSTLR